MAECQDQHIQEQQQLITTLFDVKYQYSSIEQLLNGWIDMNKFLRDWLSPYNTPERTYGTFKKQWVLLPKSLKKKRNIGRRGLNT